MAGPIARLYATLGLDAREFKGGIDGAKATIQRMGGTAQAAGMVIGAGLGTATVGAMRMGQAYADAMDSIRVGTGATGDELKGLESDFKAVAGRVPDDIGTIAQVIGDLNTRTGQTGEGLQALSEQILDLSRITGTDAATNVAAMTRLFGDWSVASEDQASALDKVFRAAQATGIGVDTLAQQMVQYGAPLRNIGYTFEDGAAMLAKWEKEGVNTILALGGLKQALGKFAKEGVDAKTGLADLVDQIMNADTAAEAMAIGVSKFGARAGPDMVAAIKEGRFAFDDLVQIVNEGSDSISQATEDTQGISEAWRQFKNVVATTVGPIFQEIGDIGTELGNLVFLIPALGGALGKGMGALWQKVGGSAVVKAAAAAAGTAAGIIYQGAAFVASKFASAAAALWGAMGGGRVIAAARGAGMLAGGAFGSAFMAAATLALVAVAALMAVELGKVRQANVELAASNSQAMSDLLAEAPSKAEAEARLAGLRAIPENLDGVQEHIFNFAKFADGNVLGSAVDGLMGANPAQNLKEQIAALETYIATIPDDLAAAVPTDSMSLTGAFQKLLGNAVGAVKALGIEAPDIAGPIKDEFAEARQAVLAGFGSLKEALKNEPKLISKEVRLDNMAARMEKIMGNLHKAVKARDPFAIDYWSRAAAKQKVQMERMRSRTILSVDDIKGNFKKAGISINGTWQSTERAAGKASRAARRTAISEFRALVGSVKGLNLQSAGTALINSWAAGIRAGKAAVDTAAAYITNGLGMFFHGSAVPKKGPLKGFDRMGGTMLDAYIGVVRGRKAKFASAGAEIAGAFSMRPRMGMAAAGATAAGGGGDTIHLHIGTLIADDRGLDELERRMSRRHTVRNRGPMRYQQ